MAKKNIFGGEDPTLQKTYNLFNISAIKISPDGKKILFSQHGLYNEYNNEREKMETLMHDVHGIWLINIDGTGLRKLMTVFIETAFDWYPDSIHIVKGSGWFYPDGTVTSKEDKGCLIKYNTETSEYEKLFYCENIKSHFRLSKDGKYIYGLRLMRDHPIIVSMEGPNMGKQYIPFEFQQIKNHKGEMVFKKWLYPAWSYDKPFDIEDYVVRRGRKLTKKEAEAAKKIKNVSINL